MNQNKFLIIGVLLFWAGFVCAISFMEAWLKFRAVGVTLPIGLSIGKKVFTALNRMEWIFFFFYMILLLTRFKIGFETLTIISLLILTILVVQTFYLLPQLDKRADLLIAGKSVDKSLLHVFYIAAEVMKVSFLILLGLRIIPNKYKTL